MLNMQRQEAEYISFQAHQEKRTESRERTGKRKTER